MSSTKHVGKVIHRKKKFPKLKDPLAFTHSLNTNTPSANPLQDVNCPWGDTHMCTACWIPAPSAPGYSVVMSANMTQFEAWTAVQCRHKGQRSHGHNDE